MIKKYILNSIKSNKDKSKILLFSSAISLILLLIFTLIFFSISEGLKNRNNEKFGQYDLQVGYIEKNKFFDNEKLNNVPTYLEKLDKLLVHQLDDNSVIYGLENNSMELEKYQISNGEKSLKNDEIIVNKNYADKYNLSLGDSVTLDNHNYKISGIVFSNSQDSLSLKIFMNLAVMQKNFNLQEKINLIQIKTSNKESVKQVLNDYFNDKKLKYDSMKNKEMDYKKIKIYTPLFYIMLISMIITYIVSLYGIFKIRLQSRLYEINVLKRIGIGNKQLYKIFIGESCYLTFVGGILGIVISGAIYTIISIVFQKLEIAFKTLAIVKFSLFGVAYLILNLLIVSLITFVLLVKDRNKYVDEIELAHKKEQFTNEKLKWKFIILLVINILAFILSKVLNNENINYVVILIAIVTFFIIFKYCFILLYKLSDSEKLFNISYSVKSFANNYKKYALVMKLMILSIVVLLMSFNYLTMFSNKVKENTLNQLPADYIITNSEQNKSENFISKSDYENIKNNVNDPDLIKINYTKDYKIASNMNYSDDWIRLSERAKVDVNEIEIIKLDVKKRNDFRAFNVVSGKSAGENFEKNELILNEKLRKLLNLKLGDSLQLRNSRTGKIENYKISTIVDNQFYPFNLIFIAPNTSKIEATNILSLELYNLMDNNYNDIRNYVNSNNSLDGIYTKDIINENLQFYNFIYFALLFLNIFILIIFIINLFNSMLLMLEERKSEIQILKNIGVSLEKIRAYIVGEIYINFFGIVIFSFVINMYVALILSLKIEMKFISLIYGILLVGFVILIIFAKKVIKKGVK